jgi:hypothetical protein
MRCAKCQGCIIEGLEERFCLNCGARPDNVPLPESRDPYARSPRCCNCSRYVTGAHRYCARCLAKMMEYNKQRQKARA